MFHIVLVHPQIPQNTGNIARTCAATGSTLHLIEPLGFSIADRYLKRAGLDYWDKVQIHVYPDFADFTGKNPGRYFLCTTKGQKRYTDFSYEDGDYFVFGSETAGLSDDIHAAYPDTRIRVPMKSGIRCFNLATSVGIILFEGLRQLNFPGFV